MKEKNDYLCRKRETMETVTIQAEINKKDIQLVEILLKRLRATYKVAKQEKDDTKMTKEEYYQMIDEARKGKKISMSREEMRKLMFE